MSSPMEAMSRRPSGVASLLLQFRQTASGTEIRAGSSDTGDTGWFDQEAADATDDLLFGSGLLRIVRNRARVRLL